MVHVFVGGAVDGPLGGELQGVEEGETLDAEGAAQLQQGVADSAGPVVHQLQNKGNEMGNFSMRGIRGLQELVLEASLMHST